MPEDPENDDQNTTENSGKPTITIAEKEGSGSSSDAAEKPTITIAEKGGN